MSSTPIVLLKYELVIVPLVVATIHSNKRPYTPYRVRKQFARMCEDVPLGRYVFYARMRKDRVTPSVHISHMNTPTHTYFGKGIASIDCLLRTQRGRDLLVARLDEPARAKALRGPRMTVALVRSYQTPSRTPYSRPSRSLPSGELLVHRASVHTEQLARHAQRVGVLDGGSAAAGELQVALLRSGRRNRARHAQ
jgi:hypothetical protein